MKSEYDGQAEQFLKKSKTTFNIKFLKHGKHFPQEKDERDIYKATFSKDKRHITIVFGQSLAHSGQYKKVPSAYDVLSCITKSNPETFENFCSVYGYDTDSITALRTYDAVVKEWNLVSYLWTDDEIAMMGEIQ